MGRTQLKHDLMSLDIIRNIEKLYPKASDFYKECFDEVRLPIVEFYSAMRHEYHRGDVIDLIEANYRSVIQDTPYTHEDICLAPRAEDIDELLLQAVNLLKQMTSNPPVTCDAEVTAKLLRDIEVAFFIKNRSKKSK